MSVGECVCERTCDRVRERVGERVWEYGCEPICLYKVKSCYKCALIKSRIMFFINYCYLNYLEKRYLDVWDGTKIIKCLDYTEN